MLAGRGSGKTLGAAHYVRNHILSHHNKPESSGRIHRCRVGVGAPTIADARDICAEGETGLITLFREEFPRYNRTFGEGWHESGAYVKFLGSEDAGRWNGPQWCLLWADELALWRHDPDPQRDAWTQADFGLRLGDNPRAIVTTTPKRSAAVKALLADPRCVVTHASTYDNPALPARTLDRLRARYEGTRLGRQELYGELLDEVENAVFPGLAMMRPQLWDYLKPDVQWARVGSGIDWGLSLAHQAAIVTGGITKSGARWFLEGWASPSGSSAALLDALGQHRDRHGGRFAVVDASQASLVDGIRGLSLAGGRGSRRVEWRIGLLQGLFDLKAIRFLSGSAGLEELWDQLCEYHYDAPGGDIVEENDDLVDAALYLIAELEHPTIDLPTGQQRPQHRQPARKEYQRA